MKREEAIKVAGEMYGWLKTDREREALKTLIPELSESNDERIRKYLIEELKAAKSVGELKFIIPQPTREECIAYLEKQKEQKSVEPSDDELQRHQDELYNFKVFAAKQAKEHHISFVHDFEWNNFCAGLLSYFNEKQKSEQYDIDVLEKHITKDSVSELAHTVIVRNGWEIVEKEQKPVPIKMDDKHMLERIMELVYFCNDKEKIWNWLCEKVKETAEWDELQAEFRSINEAFEDGKKEVIEHPERYGLQKPADWRGATINGEPISTENQSIDIPLAEWSDDIIRKAVKEVGLTQHQIDWFKTNVFPPKQGWSEDDEKRYNDVLSGLRYAHEELSNLGSLDSAYDIKQAYHWMTDFKPSPKMRRRYPTKRELTEFTLCLRNCLSSDSELTKKQANIFAKAYGKDLFDIVLGRLKSGLSDEDIEEYEKELG